MNDDEAFTFYAGPFRITVTPTTPGRVALDVTCLACEAKALIDAAKDTPGWRITDVPHLKTCRVLAAEQQFKERVALKRAARWN